MKKTERPLSLLLIILIGVLVWGGEYVRRGFWEPDEARFAYVSSEMRATGQWFAVQRYGEPYAHKPPLLMWLTNLFSVPTGGRVTTVAARLPSFIGAIMSFWVVSRLAMRWGGRAAAWRAILILASAPLVWHEVGMGRMDSLLCGLQLLAVYLLLLYEDRKSWVTVAGAYVCMGLAVLAKGPLGVVVPLGIYIAGAVAAGRGKALARWHWAWGLLVALLFPAIWLILAWTEGAPVSYFRELLFDQNVGRVAGTVAYGKSRPFYYYIYHLPLEFLPWTLLLPVTAILIRRKYVVSEAKRRLVAWFLFVFIFFTLCSGKRALYILSAYPALALLIALAWPGVASLGRRWRVATFAGAVLFAAAIWISGLVAFFHPALPIARWALLPPSLAAFGVVVWTIGAFVRTGLSDKWLRGYAVGLLVMLALTGAVTLPAINDIKTPRGQVAAMAEHLDEDDPIILYGLDLEIVPLHCGRLGRRAINLPELSSAMSKQTRGVVVAKTEVWDRARPHVAGVVAENPFRIGHKELVWVGFRRPSELSP